MNKYYQLGKYLTEMKLLELKMSDKWLDAQVRKYNAEMEYLRAKATYDSRPKSLLERLFGVL